MTEIFWEVKYGTGRSSMVENVWTIKNSRNVQVMSVYIAIFSLKKRFLYRYHTEVIIKEKKEKSA